MLKKKELLILILYLLGFLVFAMTLVLYQPLADSPPGYCNPPDEHVRYLIPKYICEHGVIPTGLEEEIRIKSYGFSYGLYNTFPYIIQGFLMRFVDLFTDSQLALLYTARMVNVFFGLCMAYVVYLSSKKLFKDRRFGWLFCFGVMYLPQSLFLHTYVNTDSCCMLATAMMVYALISAYKEGFTTGNCIWMSIGIILCALSYYNAYGYILSCILLFIAYFIKTVEGKLAYDYREMFKKGIFISVIVLLGIGWWFIRQYIVLDGDFLGLATREKMAEQYAIESVNPLTSQTYAEKGYSVWEMMKENKTLEGAFQSFVAAFGSMSMYSTVWLYRGYKVFFAIGVVGCIYWLGSRKWFSKTRSRLSGKEIFFHLNMLFCIVMPVALMIYYAYTMDYQHQGRYILPAIVPLMYYVVKGIEKLSGVRIKQFVFPGWLINIALGLCFLLIIGGTAEMIFDRCLPIYLENGMTLL